MNLFNAILGFLNNAILGKISNSLSKSVRRFYRNKKSTHFEDRTYSGHNDLSLFKNLMVDLRKFAGGREKELDVALSCLSTSQEGIILVEGLSGFGKTTFISMLMEKLDANKLTYIWHMFSRSVYSDTINDQIRFDNNIAEQIAYFLGIDFSSVNNKQNFIIDHLGNPPKNLILLIDAIDETDPGFLGNRLPKELKNGLKILISSRTIGDDRHLNFAGLFREKMHSIINMPPLCLAEIEKLMEKLNISTKYAPSVLKISRGDPFYIRFLLEDLLLGRISFEKIEKFPPGLESYLDLQFQELTESESEIHAKIVTQIVFSPIPIPKRELISTIKKLNSFNFDKYFKDIKRFFINTDEGFIVCHDRFKEFFLKKLK